MFARNAYAQAVRVFYLRAAIADTRLSFQLSTLSFSFPNYLKKFFISHAAFGQRDAFSH